MSSDEATVSEIVLSAAWTCLSGTRFQQKNVYFDQVFISEDDLRDVASDASLAFAPGLLDVLQAASPPLPTMNFFKTVTTDTSDLRWWGVYALVLKKAGCRPMLYIGSGTSTFGGVRARLKQYDDGFLLPQYVAKALDDGFDIVHKGLLCWIPRPPASKVPFRRLLFYGLEATFAFMFWAMKARLGDYGMGHICRWDRRMLEYDGVCSHSALRDGIHGDFTLSAEQLEAFAVEREKKRLALKAENATNYHYKQIHTNYDDYIGQSSARVAKSRANDPGRDKKRQADRIEKAEAERAFYCERCDIVCGTKQRLANHEKTPKHARKEFESANPFICAPCNLTRHEKSLRHIQNVEKSTMSISDQSVVSRTESAPSICGVSTQLKSTMSATTTSESTMSESTLSDSTMSFSDQSAVSSAKSALSVRDTSARPKSTWSISAPVAAKRPQSAPGPAPGAKRQRSILDMLRPKSTKPKSTKLGSAMAESTTTEESTSSVPALI
ncbi:hypothetical protein VF21_10587 [Pseudogymnoascus sp. 05NY08]|nr:hypothetical protein VF21_10587 [Pseudogymnoascus sp. 05NY08]